MPPHLLSIHDLQVHLSSTAGKPIPVVDGVSLQLNHGQTLALVGESGCGKTLTALSVLRLLPPGATIAGGRIIFDGVNLLELPPGEMQQIRGRRVAMVFQEPLSSLNPLLRVGEQVAEVLRTHLRQPARAARSRTIELLREVGLPGESARARTYPHELSGGMRQRVLIAMALAGQPDLLLADEPTTALDVTVQAQILALLRRIQQQRRMAMLFITHNLALLAMLADAVAVMYAGQIVEYAPTADLLANPRHPYTQALLRSTPHLQPTDGGAGPLRGRLPVIPGEVPTPAARPPGCPFHPRCGQAGDDRLCRTQPPLLEEVAAGRTCACWKVKPAPA